jgi:hypothetical protein
MDVVDLSQPALRSAFYLRRLARTKRIRPELEEVHTLTWDLLRELDRFATDPGYVSRCKNIRPLEHQLCSVLQAAHRDSFDETELRRTAEALTAAAPDLVFVRHYGGRHDLGRSDSGVITPIRRAASDHLLNRPLD